MLASAYGCTWHGLEIAPEFHAVAVERAAEAGIADRVSFELVDAASVTHEPESYDAALCLGASFVYGSLADTVDALAPAVRPGGHVVVGEPYWRTLPLPEDYADRVQPWTTLEGTVAAFETSGLPVVSLIAASEDDWDRYETLHWQAAERWLAANPDDPNAPEVRTWHERSKRNYLRHQRAHLGGRSSSAGSRSPRRFVAHPDIPAEQAYLDHAYRCLDRMRATLLRSAGAGATDVAARRSRPGQYGAWRPTTTPSVPSASGGSTSRASTLRCTSAVAGSTTTRVSSW